MLSMRVISIVIIAVVYVSGLCFGTDEIPYSDFAIRQSRSGMQVNEEAYRAYMQYVVNLTTPGFKEGSMANVQGPNGVETRFYHRFGPGAATETRNPLDFYIEGVGFFVIRGPWGLGYTRDGRFKLNDQNKIVTLAGEFPVQGQNGDIVVGSSMFYVSKVGAITVENNEVDRFRFVNFREIQKLRSFNGVVFYSTDSDESRNAVVVSPTIRQGYVEGSNVKLGILADLLVFRNAYDANTKAVKTVLKSYSTGIQIGNVQ
jgi:flagellar basal body rod protein FlgG